MITQEITTYENHFMLLLTAMCSLHSWRHWFATTITQVPIPALMIFRVCSTQDLVMTYSTSFSEEEKN